MGNINLPWPITVHAVGLGLIGTALLLKKSTGKGQGKGMQGIAAIGLSLAYLTTAYVPLEQNQFLYASAPARVFLGALAGLRILIGAADESERPVLIGVLLYDGIGGALLGWYLGTLYGRIPGY